MTASTIAPSPLLVSLPTADRRRAHEFYTSGLGLPAIGEPADDGVPEPLQFVMNDGVRLMFVPTGGFGWITGDHDVAAAGTSECVLGLSADSDADVDALIAKARAAGATIVIEPGPQAWGYAGAFADPDGHVWMIRAAEHDAW